ncbi:hypothetical protein JW721_02735 [Candidatus Micrarchaeota archaeon]|nr:hypothetical protein [Candidatus Micrarchaeota archaeon]
MSAEAENAFSTTARLILGGPLEGIDSYGPWLMRHLGQERTCNSFFHSKKLRLILQYAFMEKIPSNRILGFDEIKEARQLSLQPANLSTLKGVVGEFAKIALFNLDMRKGEDRNNPETIGVEDTLNTYKSQDAFNSKWVSHTSYTKFAEYSFGCYRLFYSKYCINCYNCVKCTCCFECDSLKECSRAYFCHNCENVHDALFCSNAKNLRYAVCNVPVGKESYERIKAILLTYVLTELKSKKSLEQDIFNIGEK